MVTEYMLVNMVVNGFWKRGTTTIFDVRIISLESGSYTCMAPEKALAELEADKIQVPPPFMDHKGTFPLLPILHTYRI